jgi:hypothetical protein
VHVTANFAVHNGYEGLADKHVAEADPEKQSILLDTLRPECGNVERIGYEGISENCYRRV